ncbi:VOC family protein [Streptomyces sp. HU2014]|uniref:Extradiol dioxygenase n=1 Tax=Streptomyces albireticuli TaxID=1940 RepID=A0A1Z2LD38_9ACTN|nr:MULTISPECIES: VOC family protein [Streptomyces]ARZ72227.1 extradiol dioxygenase [Streptomyces albireticuli]UQI45597.1 VOC family protein [Streptomyces sp. HU2014]
MGGISGAHIIFFTQDAEADRAFLRDVLGFPAVDAGGGWLVFRLPPAEVAVHPTESVPKHELYLMCDDIASLLGDLDARGVEITRPPTDQGWGVLAAIRLPSGAELPLYEPRHPTALAL